MWDAWKAGDRKQALDEIPDSLVDELVVHGSPAECRAKIQRYFDNGVTTSSLAVMPFPGIDHWEAVRALSPNDLTALAGFLGVSHSRRCRFTKRTLPHGVPDPRGARRCLITDVALGEVLRQPSTEL